MKRELSYLKDCPIAVLGAGAVGMTLAADCKLGQPEREVRLYSRSPKSIAYMDKTGILLDGIQRNLYAFERSGRAHLDMYTNNMEEAVKMSYKVTKDNKTCLSSPAAASYGFYLNFEKRGEHFKKLVQEYGK